MPFVDIGAKTSIQLPFMAQFACFGSMVSKTR